MLKIAVFVSGRGSNLKALYKKFVDKPEQVEICAVVSDKAECKALEFAAENSITTFTVTSKSAPEKVTYSELAHKLTLLEVDLIVLAGFLKKIPAEFINSFVNKIINIHPALLPAFGGKGMYGMNVHKAVFDKSVMLSGPTVHFVNEIYDQGKIIAQRAVDISDVNTPEEIAERVLSLEHQLLPFVVEKFAEEKIKINNNRVYII